MVLCSKRKITFLAKHDLFRFKILKFLAYAFEIIPIKRGEGDIEAFKKAYRFLNEGWILGIFPEGTRKGMAKNVEFKNGAALIALRTGTPIIPIGFKGSFKLFTKVTIYYGKPMDFSEYKSKKPDKEVLDKITKTVMEEVVRLAK